MVKGEVVVYTSVDTHSHALGCNVPSGVYIRGPVPLDVSLHPSLLTQLRNRGVEPHGLSRVETKGFTPEEKYVVNFYSCHTESYGTLNSDVDACYACVQCGFIAQGIQTIIRHGKRKSTTHPGRRKRTDEGVGCPRCYGPILSKKPYESHVRLF